ncbi:MAG: lipid A export permease/ATP-binding protein MsbA [Gammaproteobacteria bacterium]
MSNAAGKQEQGWANYRRLISYAVPYWKQFLLAVLAMVIFAATDTGFAAMMKPMLDGSFVERDPATIRWVPLVLIGLFFLRGVTGFISRYGMSWIGRNVIRRLRDDMYSTLLMLPASFFDRQTAGGILSRFSYDVEQVAEATSNVITILIRDSLTLLFLIAYMLWISPLLTLLFIMIVPLIALIVRFTSRRFRHISHAIQSSMAELTQFVDETITAQRLIKSSNAQTERTRQYAELNEQNRRSHLKLALTSYVSTPLVQFIAACTLAFVIYLASNQAYLSDITVGGFVSFMTAMMLLMQPMKRLTNMNVSLQKGVAAADSVFSLLDEAPESDSGDYNKPKIRGEIVFDHVSFTYSGNDQEASSVAVLKDVSLSINAGETIAIVGRSGSGKSTLVQLMQRFYEPDEGVIRLDDVPISRYTLANLRQHIAFVSQDIMLFNDSVENNIAFGCSPSEALTDRVKQAAKASHAYEFIEQLPEGFQTQTGDNGMRLSGGQKQRLALARAMHKDAPVLILDEATSSLDAESERYVQDAIEKVTAGRTSILIAHRLSTIEKADRIFVLDKGRLVESGTHDVLIRQEGVYASLYRMQFSSPETGA